MCKKLILLSFFIMVLGRALSVPVGAEQFLVEHFDYANGADLNGQVAGKGGWVASGTNYMVLNDDGLGDGGTSSLQYPGLTDSQGGRLAQGLTTNGDCDYILSTPVVGEGNSLYLSLLLKPTELASSYFMMFATSGSTHGSLGRLTGRESGGQQELGVRLRTSGSAGWSGKTVALGETTLVVLKLTMVSGSDNDTMELWVNPTVGQSEPPADAVSLVDAGNSVNPETGIQGFRFRTHNNAGTKEVDEIRLGTTWDDVVGSVGGAEAASAPSPVNEAADVPRDVVLSWTPGEYTPAVNGHKLYFSDDFNDVNDGIGGIILDTNEYIPDQLPDYGSTYYWRVDQANETGWNIGDIWSFQIEPFARAVPGEVITVTADSNEVGQGPENTINGSGLTGDLHSKVTSDMWLSIGGMPSPPVIQYTLDKAYKLHELWVWNYNGEGLNTIYGLKEVTIEHSLDGISWTQLDDVPGFSRAPGTDDQAPDTKVDLGGIVVRHIKITVHSNWSGGLMGLDQYGLSEVRFLYMPLFARQPQPVSGQTNVNPDVTLTWIAGREAALHDVYVGTDPNALPLLDTVNENSFSTLPVDLQLDQTYYWRIDEVNEAEVPSSWEGDVWSFSTPDYLIVDDFESYSNESPSRVFQTWVDGLGYSENEFLPDGHPGNGSNAAVGHDIWSPDSPHCGGTIIETTLVQSGAQSMPLYYENTTAPYDSEAERTWTVPQNWAVNGIRNLGLWYYGAGSVASVDYDDVAGTYTVTGGGDDNIGGGDLVEDFTFAYVTLTGDGTITAKVESVTQATDTGKAGVMIRNNLDADSAYISATCNPTGGVFQNFRLAVGEESVNSRVDYPLPYWVRVERVANNFKTFHSADGQTWAQFGDTLNIPVDGEVYTGLVVSTSQGRSAPNVAVFSNVSVTGNVSGTTFANFVDVTDDTLNVPERIYARITDVSNRAAEVEISAGGTTDNQWSEGLVDLTALTDQVDLSRVKALAIGVGDAAAGSSGLIYIDDVRLYPAQAEQ